MKKKSAAIAVIMILSMSLAFCSDGGFSEYFGGAFSFYLQIIVGVAGGALMALRFTIEVVHALVMTESSNAPGELRKVVVRFMLHFLVAAFGAGGVLALINATGW